MVKSNKIVEMKITRFIKGTFFSISVVASLVACETVTPEEEFIKGGELIYNGKPDSLMALSGNRRIKLTWVIASDPKITKAKVFWSNPKLPEGETAEPNARNDGLDSMEVAIQRTGGIQRVDAVVDRLIEGVLSFSVYHYDDAGHRSVKAETIGEVYANTYQNSISNRTFDYARYSTSKKEVTIKWFGVGQQADAVEVEYTNNSGQVVTKEIRAFELLPGKFSFAETDLLPNYKSGTTFKYRTVFKPTSDAIDKFYTEYRVVTPTVVS